MKKFLTSILASLIACVSLFCLFGCGGSKIDGKYLFQSATARDEGSSYGLVIVKGVTDEEGHYKDVAGGVFEPENFWVEIQGKTMTIHGLITPFGGGDIYKFAVAEGEEKIENFELKEVKGYAFYKVIDSNGEETPWNIHRKGESVFYQFGYPGSNGTYQTREYIKA